MFSGRPRGLGNQDLRYKVISGGNIYPVIPRIGSQIIVIWHPCRVLTDGQRSSQQQSPFTVCKNLVRDYRTEVFQYLPA